MARFRTEPIKDYIKQNNLTIKEFCKRCEISFGTYYKFMSGTTNINIRIVYRILKETNFRCKDLLMDE